MRAFRWVLGVFFLLLLGADVGWRPLRSADSPLPRLGLERLPAGQIRLQGFNVTTAVVLERSPSLDPGTGWQRVQPGPVIANGQFSFVADASDTTLFYRLRSTALTTVLSTSPGSGESGVAVRRETIFRLSAPLASTNQLTTNTLSALLGSRRLLSRAELSSDRRTITLFYLEPLPASRRITVVLEGDLLADETGSRLDADGNGEPGGRRAVVFDTVGIQAAAGTVISGHVFAAELSSVPGGGPATNRPLEGVLVTVDGSEERLSTFTDTDGSFTLNPCPAGRFFVHVDGRTALESQWPDGDYYPLVGKAWEAVAGREDNLAAGTGEIFLPLIRTNTLQSVSAVADTEIRFPSEVIAANPQLDGVRITVPANALFSDDGTRGGRVGIAPVPPDRLPEPLPAGLRVPLVITIQTDGPGNFDRPVPVRFPNLPDPATGKVLPPGAGSALWSFNHDTGRWEIQGRMTVTSDGRYLESDPGVGVRQPGWHATAPGSSGEGGDETEDECQSSSPPPECSQCLSDTDCDDGNECTEDVCINGECQNLEPSNQCGANSSATINYDQWDLGDTSSPISTTDPTGWTYDASVCYDAAAPGWRLRVNQLNSLGEILISTAYFEPTFGPGGEINNAADYCFAIDELANYYGGPVERYYHMKAASSAHEQYHFGTELPLSVSRTWPTKEIEIEALLAPCTLSAGEAEGYLRVQAEAVFARFKTAFDADWNTPDPTHDNQRKGGAFAAGQAVLTTRIGELNAYAATQGWMCPVARRALLLADPLFTDRWLSNITATATSAVLEKGAEATITVQGAWDDGSTLALPSLDIPVRFATTSTHVITVGSNGVVRAVGPGYATVTIRALPTNQAVHYRGTTLTFRVPSPEDADDDQLPRNYESTYGLSDTDATDARLDADGDGLTNLEEFLRGTHPQLADSDGDGVADGLEVQQGSNPRSRRIPRLRTVTGTQFFAVLNLDTGELVQRGLAGANGVAHSQLILAPNTRFRHWLYHAASRRLAVQEYVSGDNGQLFRLPAFSYQTDISTDRDLDGLSEVAEFVLGTEPNRADTDGDGLNDGAEVQQGSNPVDGRLPNPGIVAAIDTAGTALDVCVHGDRAVIADGPAGVAILDVSNPLQPALIAQLDTPGTAQAVACGSSLAAVADGAAGLAIIEIGDPATIRIRHQLNLGGTASAVAVQRGIAYVALGTAGVAVVDLAAGGELARLGALGKVDDIRVQGNQLWVLTATALLSYDDFLRGLQRRGSVAIPGSPAVLETGRKLVVCGSRAFVGTATGWYHLDVSDPNRPVVLGSPTGTPLSVHDLAHDGNNLLVAITSTGRTASLAVSTYDTTTPVDTTRLLNTFATPGACRAVVLDGGLAYVADSREGLQILNLRPFDSRDVAPVVRWAEPLPDEDLAVGIQLTSGRRLTLRADATDDTLVRQIELLLDGQVVGLDRSCPFEFDLTLPLRATADAQATLQLRAVDSGGSVGFSEPQVVQVRRPTAALTLESSHPRAQANVVDQVFPTLVFSAAIDPAGVSLAGITLTHLGPDGAVGGNDDSLAGIARASVSLENRVLVLTPELPLLAPGAWRLRLETTAVRNLAGVPLAAAVEIPFTVTLPTPTVEWISDAAGLWTDPTRWSTGRVPGADDHVRIDRPGADPVVTLTGDVVIRSLLTTDPLVLTGAKLTFANAHRSEIRGPTAATNSTLTLLGPGTRLAWSGLSNATDCSFVAEAGSSVEMDQLTTYFGNGISDKVFAARGVGSRIRAPQLTQVDAPLVTTLFFFSPSLRLEALDGGVLELAQVGPELNGRVDIEAVGSGSRIQLSQLERMTGPGLVQEGLETRRGGVIQAPRLSTINLLRIVTDQPATAPLIQLTSATNVTLTFNGGVADLANLSAVSTVEIVARSNALVRVPALTQYPVGGGSADWRAEGTGSRLEFPNLTTLAGPTALAGIPQLRITSVAGGTILLNQVTTLTNGRVSVLADGGTSTVDLSALTEMGGSDNTFRSSLETAAGGILALPQLRRLERVDVILDAGSTLPTELWTHFVDGELIAVGISPDLSGIVDATGAGFLAQGGSVIRLPEVRISAFTASRRWKAEGAGSRIALGTVTEVTGPTATGGLPRLELHALNGGRVELEGLTALTRGRFSILADGDGSRVELAQMTRLEVSDFSTVKAQNNGQVLLTSGLLNITGADLQVDPTGTLQVGALQLGLRATLMGAGTLVADVINGGEVRPGTSPGTLTLQGNYTQLATGSLALELGGLTPGSGHDQWIVTGAAQLAGTLALSLTGGHQPQIGDRYRIVVSGSLTGVFEKQTGHLLTNDRRLVPNYDVLGVEIQVVSP